MHLYRRVAMPPDDHLDQMREYLRPEREDDLGLVTPNTPSQLIALSDEELFRLVRKLSFANRWPVSEQVQFEATGRQIEAIDELLAETKRTNRASRVTATISLVIAAAALAVALAGTITDYYGDQGWQDDQLQILTEIRDRLPTP